MKIKRVHRTREHIMTLTKPEIQMVQASWDLLAPQGTEVAALFYTRLFLLDPALEHLFRRDMQLQGEKLTAMLGLLVVELEKLPQLTETLHQLGQLYEGYGVVADDDVLLRRSESD